MIRMTAVHGDVLVEDTKRRVLVGA